MLVFEIYLSTYLCLCIYVFMYLHVHFKLPIACCQIPSFRVFGSQTGPIANGVWHQHCDGDIHQNPQGSQRHDLARWTWGLLEHGFTGFYIRWLYINHKQVVLYIYIYASILCMYVWMDGCMDVCMYVMYVMSVMYVYYIYIYMYVRMYVCI